MTDQAFAKRLAVACNQNPNVPEYGLGRQTWVRDQMAVSHEAVRKWFAGQARPRPEKMTQLAKVLGVDEAWLALGKKGELDTKEKRVRTLHMDGAVSLVTGLLQLSGASVAYPREKDPAAAYVDLYAIRQGVQVAIHVSLGQADAQGHLHFSVPAEYEACMVIGVVHLSGNHVHLLHLEPSNLDRHAARRGGYCEVEVDYHNRSYWSDADKWSKIESFSKTL